MNSKLLKLARMVLKLAEVETDKGVLISDGALEVGVEVFVENEEGELVAAPDGEYKAEDEKVYVIADGKVAEIREPEPEQAPEQPAEAPEEQPEAEVEQEEQEPEQEPEPEEAPADDEKDKRIAELEAQIEELNNIIAEKDELIGELKAELEKSDAEPAEEQLKSQKPEQKSWTYKPRF